jgi:hypothetical protein
MGEIGDAMLCGILCISCGAYLGSDHLMGDEDEGYPRKCEKCSAHEKEMEDR